METPNEILIMNIVNTEISTFTTPQIINYFLIFLSATTGLICLGQFLYKANKKARQSPLIRYGLQAEIKNRKLEKRLLCACSHKYKPHVSGQPTVVMHIFPQLKYTHICAGILYACLIRKCHTELILQRQELKIINHHTVKTFQIGFNAIPIWKETNNLLWEQGFTDNIINIEVRNQNNCKHPWRTPASLLQDTSILVWHNHCVTSGKIHVRAVQNSPDKLYFCAFNQTKFNLFLQSAHNCFGHSIQFWDTSRWSRQQIRCTEPLSVSHWSYTQASENTIEREKCSPKFILKYSNGQYYEIHNLNDTWIQAIVRSQGPKIRHNQHDCKTQQCVLVQRPVIRTKRQVVDTIQEENFKADFTVHCGGFLFYHHCPYAATRTDVTKLGNIRFRPNEVSTKRNL